MWQTKNSYTPGEWNVQSVMLGGLGKDPELTGQYSAPFNSMPYFRHIYTYIISPYNSYTNNQITLYSKKYIIDKQINKKKTHPPALLQCDVIKNL